MGNIHSKLKREIDIYRQHPDNIYNEITRNKKKINYEESYKQYSYCELDFNEIIIMSEL